MHPLLPSALPGLGQITLCVLILGAVWNDCRNFRIPNRLVAFGIGAGIAVNMLSPDIAGLPGAASGALGAWHAVQGMGIGFAALLPFYCMRVLGAGDVKLMAMIGAFVGPGAIAIIIFMSFIVGGLLSLAVALRRRKFRQLVTNLQAMLIALYLNMLARKAEELAAPAASVGTLPYAIAIGGGTFLYLAVTSIAPLQRLVNFW